MNERNVLTQPKKVHNHYASDEHLVTRIKTHETYTVPRVNFPEWVLDNISWQGNETIVDVGCGSGIYVGPCTKRASRYIAADLSLGMLRNLANQGIDRVNLDARSLPLAASSVDVILANHMLYHLPDLGIALLEFRRVLRPGGKLIAATNSDIFMHQINEIVDVASRSLGGGRLRKIARDGFIWPFTLENGRDRLTTVFEHVDLHELRSKLVFPAAEPVLAYINSTSELYLPHLKDGVRWQDVLLEVERLVQKQIDSQGTFRVNKHNGVFVCHN